MFRDHGKHKTNYLIKIIFSCVVTLEMGTLNKIEKLIIKWRHCFIVSDCEVVCYLHLEVQSLSAIWNSVMLTKKKTPKNRRARTENNNNKNEGIKSVLF